MPVLQYVCTECGKEFEELVQSHDVPVRCPHCGGKAARQWSGTVYSSTGKKCGGCSGNCKTCGGCR